MKLIERFMPALLYAVPFVSIRLAHASELNAVLPGSYGSEAGPGGFVANFYQFALALSGVLAFGAIVWGGVQYTFARGNPAGQSEGKKWITGALLGLALLGGAYLLLYTINPEIVSLKIKELK